jgi:AraC-like DNA-binding protein
MIAVQRIHLAQSQPAKTTASKKLMRGFANLIEENVRLGKSVAWYASALHVSTAHLSRVCQAENHKPASRYLQERVLANAQAMLRETEIPIAQIASKLHFSSPAYFSRLFTEKLGVTPREYRKNERDRARRSALVRYG